MMFKRMSRVGILTNRQAPTAAAIVVLSMAQWATAADSTDGAARASREVRQEARSARKLFSLLPDEPPPTRNQLIIGVSHDSAEDGTRVTNTPFNYSYRTSETTGWWKFQTLGDGYALQATPGQPALGGVADLKLNLFHDLGHDVVVGAGLAVPTHGEVGSSRFGERVQAVWTPTLASSLGSTVIVTILHAPTGKPGESAFAQRGYAEVNWRFSNGDSVLVNVDRVARSGTPSTSTAGLEFDFAITGQGLGGALVASRGLTSGSRHTGFEFDLVFAW